MEVQYICLFLLGYVTFCYGQEASVVLPSRCAAVLCVQPSCPNPVILKGECCHICFDDCTLVDCGDTPIDCVAPPGGCCPVCNPRKCNINGGVVDSGVTIKDNCNTCICSDGYVFCTKWVCVEKPGTCPQLNPLGHCAELCSSDQGCPGIQKCCSVGCGRDCMNPINTPRTCSINGEVVENGATVKVDCNTCQCRDGDLICTLIACEKPGTCPSVSGPGICVDLCSSDQNCQGQQKCCSNGCGHVCMDSVLKPRTCNINGEVVDDGATVKVDCNTCTCSDGNVICTEKACIEKPGTCPQLRNPLNFGICAELCSSDQGCPGVQKCCSVGCGRDCMNPISTPTQPDCSYVTCPSLPGHCRSRGYTPPGQCCPICPGNQGYWRRRHRYED